jgi:hypothetical protein
MPEGITIYPIPGGNKYRNLALQIGGERGRIPWGPDLRKTVLAMSSKNWKLWTLLLVREGAPHQQIRNCLK